MASIDILSPIAGSTVPQVFTARGVYAPFAAGSVQPVVRLEDGSFSVVATGLVTVVAGTEDWSAAFNVVTGGNDLTLIAELPGTGEIADEPNITVALAPVIGNVVLVPIPAPAPAPPAPPAPAAAAVEIIRVQGTYTAGVAVLVTAFAYTANNRLESILASAGATLNNPAAGQWTVDLTITLPVGRRLVVRALAIHPKGKIIGNGAIRRKK